MPRVPLLWCVFALVAAPFGATAESFDAIVFRTGYENAVCPNGAIEDVETCDDGDAASGDGCSDRCAIEFGYYCEGAPSVCGTVCNDAAVAGTEACDDGNGAGGDGCDALCAVEPGFTCSGTPSVCDAFCSDGIIAGGETCDDGDTDAGDGCSATCTVETGFSCIGVPSVCATTCSDGIIAGGESCDDGGTDPGDGCSATCTVESGFSCTGAPSVCTTICGDGIVAGVEACDDGDPDETDGCTTQCVVGKVCTAVELPGADRFTVDPANGRCYASYDGEATTFTQASTACTTAGGTLVTLTSSGEATLVDGVRNPAENPWIGATDTTNEGSFEWLTGEPFVFTRFASKEPDNDIGGSGNADCLHLGNAAGEWADTACDSDTFVTGRICEFQP